MKENLILKQFKKELVNGTFNLLEEETFFGSKIMEIEDEIIIDDKSIQYFQYYYTSIDPNDVSGQTLAKNNGYQYHDLNTFYETFYLLDVVALKLQNHTISKAQQTKIDEKNNTKWLITIDIRNILKEYLFAKIKERRTFNSITYDELINNDINQSIYNYIELNLLDRFTFNYIDFYVLYHDIKGNSIWNNLTLKQFDPQYRSDIESEVNRNKSVNVQIDNFIDPLANLTINYYQTMPSTDYKFSYYFNIYFKKI